jgi:hypothetical protein
MELAVGVVDDPRPPVDDGDVVDVPLRIGRGGRRRRPGEDGVIRVGVIVAGLARADHHGHHHDPLLHCAYCNALSDQHVSTFAGTTAWIT